MADPVVRAERARSAESHRPGGGNGAARANGRAAATAATGAGSCAAVERYERPLVRYAAHVIGDPDAPATWCRTRSCGCATRTEAKLGSHVAEWLYTVCRNLAIDVKRKERRMRLLSDAQADRSSPTTPPRPSRPSGRTRVGVLRAMGDLPENQQECIRLKFQHGLSYKQISQVTPDRHQRRLPDSHGAESAEEGNGGRARVRE